MQIYNVIVLFVIYWRNLLHLAITPRTSLSLSSDDPKIAYVCLCRSHEALQGLALVRPSWGLIPYKVLWPYNAL